MLSSGSVASGVGVYWLFFGGADRSAASPVRPGLALSQDGRHWARVEGDQPCGSLLGCGGGGEWDAGGCGSARLCVAGPRDLRLYYSSTDRATGRSAVGMARSADGLAWAKAGLVFRGGGGGWEARGAAAPHVHRTGPASWLMFYEGRGADGARSVGVARSADGVAWRAAAGGDGGGAAQPPLLGPGPAGAWDAGGAGAPCAVPMAKGRWRLYYEGYAAARQGPGGEEGGGDGCAAAGRDRASPCGIGLALGADGADGDAMAPFRRWQE